MCQTDDTADELSQTSLQGYGKRVMFGIEVHTFEAGLPCKISATVDTRQARLIAFYQSLGAVTEQNSASW